MSRRALLVTKPFIIYPALDEENAIFSMLYILLLPSPQETGVEAKSLPLAVAAEQCLRLRLCQTGPFPRRVCHRWAGRVVDAFG